MANGAKSRMRILDIRRLEPMSRVRTFPRANGLKYDYPETIDPKVMSQFEFKAPQSTPKMRESRVETPRKVSQDKPNALNPVRSSSIMSKVMIANEKEINDKLATQPVEGVDLPEIKDSQDEKPDVEMAEEKPRVMPTGQSLGFNKAAEQEGIAMALNFGCYSSILPTAKPEDDQALVTVSGVVSQISFFFVCSPHYRLNLLARLFSSRMIKFTVETASFRLNKVIN